MADIFTKAKRSEVMARIRGRGNQDTELALAKLLRANRISGWRRHVQVQVPVRSRRREEANDSRKSPKSASLPRRLRVRPDFVFRQARTVIFVDGCFWHGCPKHATQPKNHRAFWRRKLSGNKARDQLVNRALRGAGWRVVRIWECDLARQQTRVLRRIQRALTPFAGA